MAEADPQRSEHAMAGEAAADARPACAEPAAESRMADLRSRLAGIERAWRQLFGPFESRPRFRLLRGGRRRE